MPRHTPRSALSASGSTPGNTPSAPRRTLEALSVALLTLLATGCFREHAYSGLPPGDPAPRADERWHHGALWGLVNISGTYRLKELCPGGWAELHAKTDVAHGALTLLTAGLYAPKSVTVICAAPAEPAQAEASSAPIHRAPPSKPAASGAAR
ncbi:MAG: hypothetical protein KIT72_10850 [Polyangiaceae bacterium]|nr:hypothetical protein [Polyangiaceae bacterium]MCW5790910.1 hypothetical protein [Polyangiaceae bacterium]